jgi:hypothetical protein
MNERDAPLLLGLLRMRAKRKHDSRTTQDTEKIPPPHVSPSPRQSIVSAQISTLIGAELNRYRNRMSTLSQRAKRQRLATRICNPACQVRPAKCTF